MLLKPEPLFAAVEALRGPETRVILMTPQGKPFKQAVACELAAEEHLLILCGHYEGVDHRVIEVEDVSRELCGGTHVANTAEVGILAIVHEGSSAANVRRPATPSGSSACRAWNRRTAASSAASKRSGSVAAGAS